MPLPGSHLHTLRNPLRCVFSLFLRMAPDDVQDPWRYISEAQLKLYYEFSEPYHADAHLSAILGTTSIRHDAKAAAWVNFTAFVLQFCKEMHLSATQTGILVNVSQAMLQSLEERKNSAHTRQGVQDEHAA